MFQKEGNSYYSKTNYENIRLTKDGNNIIHVSTDLSLKKYCIKTTKSIPNKNNICWKDINDNAINISSISGVNQYLWLLDSNDNIT